MHKLLDDTWTSTTQNIVCKEDESIDQEFGLDNISKSQWMKELPRSVKLVKGKKDLAMRYQARQPEVWATL